MRVLVVEDDRRLAATLQRGLAQEGVAVDIVGDGDEALVAVRTAPFDLIVLDIMLPGDTDGFGLCHRLRDRGVRTPVLMLTARDTVEDRVRGLDAGADDYLVKPFDFSELLARVRALTRRHPDQRTVTVRAGPLEFDTVARQVRVRGQTVGFTLKELAILESISATSRDTIDAAQQEVTDLLLQNHHITDPSQADFKITTQEQILNTLDATSAALTLLLAGVAGISLLVGGIGVMNIMLVSVTERVAEIGLRKALGAKRRDILRQFLIEAASLSAGGGLLGVAFGALSTFLLSRLTTLATVFLPSVAIIGLSISVAIGVVFGVLPAIRAARLEPIVALRGG